MPELPEVETIIREMHAAKLVGATIEKATVFWERSITRPSVDLFCEKIAGQAILDIKRRGKYLVFYLTKNVLIVHLRMTGKFLINDQISSHERVRLLLSDGRILRFEDMRKFGKWILSESDSLLDKIGLEPLSKKFTLVAFKNLLQNKKRQVKPFLLDQKFVAGLGNIYVDEALWLSKIHPSRGVDTLNRKEMIALHQAIIDVLKAGVENTGTSLGATRANYYSVSGKRGENQKGLKVFRRDGLPCPRCQTILKKIVVGQRGTHFCPTCQKLESAIH